MKQPKELNKQEIGSPLVKKTNYNYDNGLDGSIIAIVMTTKYSITNITHRYINYFKL